MSQTRASKTRGRKLDSIISKLKIPPSKDATDPPNESSKPEKESTEAREEEKNNQDQAPTNTNNVERKKSKRKSNVIVRYRIDDDDEEDDNFEVIGMKTNADTSQASQDNNEENEDQKDTPENNSQLPETIFEELPNGDATPFAEEDTTVFFLAADKIEVKAGPSDDYLSVLLDGADDSNHEEQVSLLEDGQEREKSKKKKKKKKVYDSDESLDEDGLPRRVICTGCGRHVNPSHGTILRHPVLNVLVCKKCNQYYNSGPFTRDEYGIEEQCRWCGDGGDLICCDDCEKVYCKPCIQRNLGKTFLKNLLNAPEDFKWLCVVCEKDKPTKHMQRLRKKCEQVMQALENVKSKKAHFKSKKGQQPSVVIGPTTSERRNRLNCLSEGLKAEGFSSSGESPTKKCFDGDLPAKLFNDENQQEAGESNLDKDTSSKDKDNNKTVSDDDKEHDPDNDATETKDKDTEDDSEEEVLSKKIQRIKDKDTDENKMSDEAMDHPEETEQIDENEKQEEEEEVSEKEVTKGKTRSQLNRESSKDEDDEQNEENDEEQESDKEVTKRKTRSRLNRESSKDEENDEEKQDSEKEVTKQKTRSQLNRESSKDEDDEQNENNEEEEQDSDKQLTKGKTQSRLNKKSSRDEDDEQNEKNNEEEQDSDKEVTKRKTRGQLNRESSKDESEDNQNEEDNEEEQDSDKEVTKRKTRSQLNRESNKVDKQNKDKKGKGGKAKRKTPLNRESSKDEEDDQNEEEEKKQDSDKEVTRRKTRNQLNQESSKDEESEQNKDKGKKNDSKKEVPKQKRKSPLNRDLSADEEDKQDEEEEASGKKATKQKKRSPLNRESSEDEDEQSKEDEEQSADDKISKIKPSQIKEESKDEEEDFDPKDACDDRLRNDPKKKKTQTSKKSQEEEQSSTEIEYPEQDDDDSSSTEEEQVRTTRRGKITVAKPRTRENSKNTPCHSEEENAKKAKRKGKTALERVKQESQSDELDSSDSSLGRRLSRKSKDRANKLMIKSENKNTDKKQQSKTVVVIDLDDDTVSNDSGSNTEKSKGKKNAKNKENKSSKGKEKATENSSTKKEKGRDSSDSNSKPTRSRRRSKVSDSPVRSKKNIKQESESGEIDSDEDLDSLKTRKSKRKQQEDEMSSDSDFKTKKKTTNKPSTSRKQKNFEDSSDTDEEVTPSKSKSGNSDYSIQESSESDESSSESESDVPLKSSRSRGLQKQTRKRPRPVASSSNSEMSSEESSGPEEVAKRTRKRKQIQSDTSDESPKREKTAGKNKRQKKTIKKGRKGRKTRQKALESEESEASGIEEPSSESDSEPEKKKQKGKQKKNQKGKKPAKNKKRRRVKNNSDDSSDDDKEDTSPTKGRKKIRKLLTDEKLGDETRKARRLEEERRNRLLERTRTAEDEEMPRENWHLNSVVLEKDKETKEPLVEIHGDLVQHLKPHQSKGIQFMYDNVVDSVEAYKKGDKGGGCILAHCMGLGKTLQVVSLIHTLHNYKEFEFRTTLVIAPLNTVLNWQVEFDKWLNVDERMDVYVLKEAGHNNWHRADMLKQWQRYGGILIVGYDSYRNLSQCSRVRSKHQKKIFKESLVDPGPDLVVCDEGHILRNDQSAISKAVNSIKTRRRIVLTGTPLQNNLIEYHCMVSFVKPNLLGTRKEFMNLFGNPIMNGQCVDSSPMDVKIMKQSAHVLYKLLEGCVQRRDYSVLTPFLPPKHEYVVKIRMSEVQRKLYSHYLNTFVFPEGTISNRGASLFSDYQCLMRIWTHPWCLKLEAIRRSLRSPYTDSENSLDGFVVHSDEESESDASSDEMSLKSDSSPPSSPNNKKKNGKVFEIKSSSDEDSDGNNTSDDEVMPQPSRRMTRSNGPVKVDGEKDKKKDNETVDTVNGDESNTRSGANFKEETLEEKEWYDEFLTPEDEYNVELSGKLALLLEILADAEAVEEKVLVFSQSLVTLDLVERAIGGGEVGGDRENWCRGCDYFRMDGSTTVQLRQRWADIFNDPDNKTARLFLISTKAGGLGINLVAANRVVVFDVSWNPSHDVQSIFRVFRFGQTKPVYVYRLVAEGSMEERIYDRQIAKLSTSQRVIDKHQVERHFTAADLSELYRFTPSTYDEEKDKDSVPSLPLPKDAVLADLINRMHPKWIVKYHEHDSLLQNKQDEQLTDEECKQAWAAYEAQKDKATQNFNMRLVQSQYAQQQLQQQRQAIPSQNLNYNDAVLRQMQEYQRQQLARMQAGAALQMHQGHRFITPSHGQQIHNEQLRQQLLQHLGASRPVYQPPPGATFQPMVRYVSQAQQQQPGQRIMQPHLPPAAGQPRSSTPTQPNTIVIRHSPPTYRL